MLCGHKNRIKKYFSDWHGAASETCQGLQVRTACNHPHEEEGAEHFQNSRARASQNLLLHKSNKNTDKNCQNQLFWTLEINQRLATIRRVFMQEKWLNLSKNNTFSDILTWPIPTRFSPDQRSCWRQQPWNHRSCGTQPRHRHGREPVGTAAPQENHCPTCRITLWKRPFSGLAFVCPGLGLPHEKNSIPRNVTGSHNKEYKLYRLRLGESLNKQ